MLQIPSTSDPTSTANVVMRPVTAKQGSGTKFTPEQMAKRDLEKLLKYPWNVQKELLFKLPLNRALNIYYHTRGTKHNNIRALLPTRFHSIGIDKIPPGWQLDQQLPMLSGFNHLRGVIPIKGFEIDEAADDANFEQVAKILGVRAEKAMPKRTQPSSSSASDSSQSKIPSSSAKQTTAQAKATNAAKPDEIRLLPSEMAHLDYVLLKDVSLSVLKSTIYRLPLDRVADMNVAKLPPNWTLKDDIPARGTQRFGKVPEVFVIKKIANEDQLKSFTWPGLPKPAEAKEGTSTEKVAAPPAKLVPRSVVKPAEKKQKEKVQPSSAKPLDLPKTLTEGDLPKFFPGVEMLLKKARSDGVHMFISADTEGAQAQSCKCQYDASTDCISWTVMIKLEVCENGKLQEEVFHVDNVYGGDSLQSILRNFVFDIVDRRHSLADKFKQTLKDDEMKFIEMSMLLPVIKEKQMMQLKRIAVDHTLSLNETIKAKELVDCPRFIARNKQGFKHPAPPEEVIEVDCPLFVFGGNLQTTTAPAPVPSTFKDVVKNTAMLDSAIEEVAFMLTTNQVASNDRDTLKTLSWDDQKLLISLMPWDRLVALIELLRTLPDENDTKNLLVLCNLRLEKLGIGPLPDDWSTSAKVPVLPGHSSTSFPTFTMFSMAERETEFLHGVSENITLNEMTRQAVLQFSKRDNIQSRFGSTILDEATRFIEVLYVVPRIPSSKFDVERYQHVKLSSSIMENLKEKLVIDHPQFVIVLKDQLNRLSSKIITNAEEKALFDFEESQRTLAKPPVPRLQYLNLIDMVYMNLTEKRDRLRAPEAPSSETQPRKKKSTVPSTPIEPHLQSPAPFEVPPPANRYYGPRKVLPHREMTFNELKNAEQETELCKFQDMVSLACHRSRDVVVKPIHSMRSVTFLSHVAQHWGYKLKEEISVDPSGTTKVLVHFEGLPRYWKKNKEISIPNGIITTTVPRCPTTGAENWYETVTALPEDPLVQITARDCETRGDNVGAWWINPVNSRLIEEISRRLKSKLVRTHLIQWESNSQFTNWFHFVNVKFEDIAPFFVQGLGKHVSARRASDIAESYVISSFCRMGIIPLELYNLIRKFGEEWIDPVLYACRERFAFLQRVIRNPVFFSLNTLAKADLYKTASHCGPLSKFSLAYEFARRMRDTALQYWSEHQILCIPKSISLPSTHFPVQYFIFVSVEGFERWGDFNPPPSEVKCFGNDELLPVLPKLPPWEKTMEKERGNIRCPPPGRECRDLRDDGLCDDEAANMRQFVESMARSVSRKLLIHEEQGSSLFYFEIKFSHESGDLLYGKAVDANEQVAYKTALSILYQKLLKSAFVLPSLLEFVARRFQTTGAFSEEVAYKTALSILYQKLLKSAFVLPSLLEFVARRFQTTGAFSEECAMARLPYVESVIKPMLQRFEIFIRRYRALITGCEKFTRKRHNEQLLSIVRRLNQDTWRTHPIFLPLHLFIDYEDPENCRTNLQNFVQILEPSTVWISDIKINPASSKNDVYARYEYALTMSDLRNENVTVTLDDDVENPISTQKQPPAKLIEPKDIKVEPAEVASTKNAATAKPTSSSSTNGDNTTPVPTEVLPKKLTLIDEQPTIILPWEREQNMGGADEGNDAEEEEGDEYLD
ncbi:hypothetical protein OESDEN_02766 [Oesophagostomum dentatum]|uniref:BCD1 alpha/beta domain-containing protein n=1 Tax=Oesophagostomum dentatum TaxID=61180 RepID=A0A0B1TI93_OESDE|nr:hypothetical protein OESDEN_02766 [Oesophagostomum dentatum]